MTTSGSGKIKQKVIAETRDWVIVQRRISSVWDGRRFEKSVGKVVSKRSGLNV
jgi:hypothetical protein